MSDRSLFPEGCTVSQNDLKNEVDSRIAEHLSRSLDEASMGVVSGLVVSVGAVDNTRVDVTAGYGYAPNGELVELAPGQSSLALASGVLGAVNYVVLVSSEVQSRPLPHESNGTSPFSRAVRASRLRTYTAAQFAALPLTSTNLAADAQDRALLLAVVTATGGALAPGSIELPTVHSTINYASAPQNVTGVRITAVDSGTAEGVGTLTWTLVGTFLSWQAPGEAVGGNVNVGGGGAFVLTSGGGSTLGIFVIAGSLPAANQSDSITIANLYSEDVPRFTSEDSLHRSLLGSGTPSPGNPHGLTIEDIGGSELAELSGHIDLQHTNGIWRNSAAACLEIGINEGIAPDGLTITAPAGGDTYWVNGARLSAVLNTTVSLAAGPATANLYEVLVDSEGAVTISARATWPNPRVVTGVEIIDIADTTAVGAKNLAFLIAGTTLAWDSGPAVNVAAGGRFRLISSNERDTLDVFVVAASLPAGNQTDAITVNALADQDAYMRLAMVCWTGSATGFLGYTPTRGVVNARVLDKRTYGTLSDFDRADEVIRTVVPADGSAPMLLRRFPEERNQDELRASGVIFGLDQTDANSLGVSSGGGLNISVAGGVCYIFGKRFVRAEQTGFALPAVSTSWVYLDSAGVLRYSTTLSLREIVGGVTASGGDQLNNPGLGIVLAQVTTDGAGIVTGGLVDYRRNITRSDNLPFLSVASPTLGTGPRAQFCSLRAAVDYCINIYGRNEIRVVGGLSEDLITAIGLTTQFRIVLEPDSTLSFLATGGAAAAFSLTVNGALELQGAGLISSAIDLIAYASGASGYVSIDKANILLSGTAALIRVSASTANERGVLVRDSSIISSAAADPLVDFSTGFDSQFVLRNCYLEAVDDIIDVALGGADAISYLSIVGCHGSCTSLLDTDSNTTLNDSGLLDCTFTTTGPSVVLYDTNRVRIRGGSLSSAGRTIWLIGDVDDLSIKGVTLTSPVAVKCIESGAGAQLQGLTIQGCKFPAATTTGASIYLEPDGAGTCSQIIVADNIFAYGFIHIGKVGGAGDLIRDVLISGNTLEREATASGYAIFFDHVQRWDICGNVISIVGVSRGIVVNSNSEVGVVHGNTILGGVGIEYAIQNGANDDVSIDGNTIYLSDATSLVAIQSTGRCTITGNKITSASTDASGYAVVLPAGAEGSAVTGNSVEYTGVATTDAFSVGAADCTFSGNSVMAQAGCTLQGIVSAQDDLVVTGNRFPATAAAPDVSLTGDRVCFVGNTVATAALVGTVTLGGAGTVPAVANTLNVVT